MKKVIEVNKDKDIFEQASAVQDKTLEECNSEIRKELKKNRFSKPAFSNEELQFKKTPWAIGKFLRGWQMNVPDGHIYGSDTNVFLSHIRPKIIAKLKNELSELKNIKFQLALKVLMSKE